MEKTDSKTRIRVLSELLRSKENLDYHTYTEKDLPIKRSKDSFEDLLRRLFWNEVEKLSPEEKKKPKPIIISNGLYLLWLMEYDEKEDTTHVYGPVFSEDISDRRISFMIQTMDFSFTHQDIDVFLDGYSSLPVLSLTKLLDYGTMLHYCLKEEKITISDISYGMPKKTSEEPLLEKHASYLTEQKWLKLIEEGNPGYKEMTDHLSMEMSMPEVFNNDSIRTLKNMVIINIALCTRAAIKGGLSSSIAYALSDNYIHDVENTSSLSEIGDISNTMQEDFVTRIQKYKESLGISKNIRECMDYLSLHCAEKITLASLASRFSYTATYLCAKFEKETKQTIQEYLTDCRIEKAKLLLLSESFRSISEVASLCGYSSQSQFGLIFKKKTGMTPLRYQNRGKE